MSHCFTGWCSCFIIFSNVFFLLPPYSCTPSCNFVNVYMIAYRVHVYTRASLIHSPNPNPDSSNRKSPYHSVTICGARRETGGSNEVWSAEMQVWSDEGNWADGTERRRRSSIVCRTDLSTPHQPAYVGAQQVRRAPDVLTQAARDRSRQGPVPRRQLRQLPCQLHRTRSVLCGVVSK